MALVLTGVLAVWNRLRASKEKSVTTPPAGRTWIVNITSDDGPGSLREALDEAAIWPGADTIIFASNLSGSIMLANELVVKDPSGVTVEGGRPGGVTIDGGPAVNRIFSVGNGASLTLRNLTLTGGSGGGASGTGNGGAIFNNGLLVAVSCTFATNTSPGNGGAVANGLGGMASFTNCTFFGNTQTGAKFLASGGVALNNAAISRGMTLSHCTIVGNTSSGRVGGGGIRSHGRSLTLHNCIIAGNTSALGPDVSIDGFSVSAGGNLIGNSANLRWNGLDSDRVGNADSPLDPRLAVLGHHGGPTPTMPPLPGSPAIDSGATSSLTNDQRGRPRPVGAAPDVGAVENGGTR